MEIITETAIRNTIVRVVRGDITESNADAIVNAANSYLKHGGGVAGAIVRKGGVVIQEESNHVGYVPVGQCAITTGGMLKAKYVLHAVGPRWGEGDEEEKLRNAVRNTLKLATERTFKSLSMPAISAGIFGFPKERCAQIITHEVSSFIETTATTLREINFCLMDDQIIALFTKELEHFKGDS
ncbi:MAG: O-acetyl-ADP-ribose deacetylase [Syntrophorhabdus sp. PtaU1.Bin153]|nr:MAG: O-acetyl-ADP-ribose deacetylase [Syntrophorhabdus sp. PtaU1.Bin153]